MGEIVLVLTALLVILGFHIYRLRAYRFRCAHCKRQFQARFWPCLLSRGHAGAKHMTCPICGQKGWHLIEPPESGRIE